MHDLSPIRFHRLLSVSADETVPSIASFDETVEDSRLGGTYAVEIDVDAEGFLI